MAEIEKKFEEIEKNGQNYMTENLKKKALEKKTFKKNPT